MPFMYILLFYSSQSSEPWKFYNSVTKLKPCFSARHLRQTCCGPTPYSHKTTAVVKCIYRESNISILFVTYKKGFVLPFFFFLQKTPWPAIVNQLNQTVNWRPPSTQRAAHHAPPCLEPSSPQSSTFSHQQLKLVRKSTGNLGWIKKL